MTRLFGISIIFSALLFVGPAQAKHRPTPTPTPTGPISLSMSPTAWVEHYNSPATDYSVANNVLFDDAGSLGLIFPDSASGTYYNYLTYSTHLNISTLHFISMTVSETTVSGAPVFQTQPSDTCSGPTYARLMIWGNNDNWSDGYRWWSNAPLIQSAFPLDPGQATITIPIDPADWTGVYGERADTDLAYWNATIGNVSSLAITFGRCFFGHGVDTTGGSAKFDVTSYQVN